MAKTETKQVQKASKRCPKCKSFHVAEKLEKDLKSTFDECYDCGHIFNSIKHYNQQELDALPY